MKARFILRYKTHSLMIDVAIYAKFFKEYDVLLSNENKNLNNVDVSFHIEFPFESFKKYSKFNVLMINHEYMTYKLNNYQQFVKKLKNIDIILVKTKIGLRLLKDIRKKHFFDSKIIYTKFNSIIPKNITTNMDYNKILHFAGGHKWKQTDIVLKTWMKYHDKLPPIYILCHSLCKENIEHYLQIPIDVIKQKYKNIHLFSEPITDKELWYYKTSIGIHLCPSISEGFGHYINESRALGAFVIITNSPPMNELINNDCGYLIDCYQTLKKTHVLDDINLCFLNEDVLYNNMKHVLKLPKKTYHKKGDKAKIKYLKDKKYFNEKMNKVISYLQK